MFEIFWATVITLGSHTIVDTVHGSRSFCEEWNQKVVKSETWKIINSSQFPASIECFPTTESTFEGAVNQIKILKIIDGSIQSSI